MRRKNVIVISALVVFALWGAIESKPTSDTQDNQKQIFQSEYDKPRRGDSTPIVPPSGPPSKNVSPTEANASDHNRYYLWGMAWLAWARSWIAKVIDEPPNFFAFMVAVFTYFLWEATVGLREVTADLVSFAEEQSRDMKASVAVAKEAADAARDSIKLPGDASERQLRAYVLVQEVIFVFPHGPTGKAYINTIIKNFGQTPCYKAIVKFECDICPTKLPDFIIPFTNNAETHSNVIIAPGHMHTITIDRTAEVSGEGQWAAFKRAGKCTYVWGRIDYMDAFGQPHFTTFQMYCPFFSATSFALSKNGNDAN